jgi:hypothetical protein
MFIKWFHHLFNPHCPTCAIEKLCKNCDTLRDIIESERLEKARLLQLFIDKQTPMIEPVVKAPEALQPKAVSWRIKKEMLEAEDRAKAAILAREKRSTEEIERGLEIDAGQEREAI